MKAVTLILMLFFARVILAKNNSFKIYAASSLSNVLQEIAQEYGSDKKIIFNFDASSILAKQIESGAPADVYFSADAEWMNYLDQRQRLISESRVNLLSNQMVVVVPVDSARIPMKATDLNETFYHHIALAEESVPSGKFARASLKAQGAYSSVFQKKIVNAKNVRVALSWVAKHEAAAGIVYATDAKIENKIKVAFVFPENSHPKIIYPVAIVKTSPATSEAKKFINFCKSKKAQAIFQKAGFIIL